MNPQAVIDQLANKLASEKIKNHDLESRVQELETELKQKTAALNRFVKKKRGHRS